MNVAAKLKTAKNKPEVTAGGRVIITALPEQMQQETPADVLLGLDLGTRCGYAFAVRATNGWKIMPWQMGVWDLSVGRWDTGNLAFLRLRRFLQITNPLAVFYEDVKYTPAEAITKYNAARALARAATASELLGAFKHTVMMWAEDAGVYAHGYPIGTIKRRATGSGTAAKEAIVQACNEEFQTEFDVDTCRKTGADNVADAAFALLLGIEEYGGTLLKGDVDGPDHNR